MTRPWRQKQKGGHSARDARLRAAHGKSMAIRADRTCQWRGGYEREVAFARCHRLHELSDSDRCRKKNTEGQAGGRQGRGWYVSAAPGHSRALVSFSCTPCISCMRWARALTGAGDGVRPWVALLQRRTVACMLRAESAIHREPLGDSLARGGRPCAHRGRMTRAGVRPAAGTHQGVNG